MIADRFRVPHAAHMLVPLPESVPALRAAAASDNLSDAWRAVAVPLAQHSRVSVAILGGGAKSIGLYAAGIAAYLGAATVHYVDVDVDAARCAIAARLGAQPLTVRQWSATPTRGYDIVVEATSTGRGLRHAIRATASGGVCTAVGYYVGVATGVPVMHMYATDITLRVGVSHARAVLPDVLDFVATTKFPAEQVTTMSVPWRDAPHAYTARTTKLVLHRPPIHHR